MEIKKTITSIFMVPTLGINKELLKGNGFINGYSKDGSRDVQYQGSVYLLFKPAKLQVFREFLDGEYERTKTIIDDYDYNDDDHHYQSDGSITEIDGKIFKFKSNL